MIFKEMGEVDYPTTDGRPMAETDTHRDQMVDLIRTLQRYFRHRNDVYVSGNILLYYEKGNKRRHISPDVLVVFGINKGKRDYYLLWEEGCAPQFVIEITSSSTRWEDMFKKKRLYAAMGVQEYFIFDPLRDYLKPQLRGYRRAGGRWVPIHGKRMHSEVVGLDLRIHENELRLVEPQEGSLLPLDDELIAEAQRAADEARRAADEARRAAEDAMQAANEERAARLRIERELQRLRAGFPEISAGGSTT